MRNQISFTIPVHFRSRINREGADGGVRINHHIKRSARCGCFDENIPRVAVLDSDVLCIGNEGKSPEMLVRTIDPACGQVTGNCGTIE